MRDMAKKQHTHSNSIKGGTKATAISNAAVSAIKSWSPMAVNYDKK